MVQFNRLTVDDQDFIAAIGDTLRSDGAFHGWRRIIGPMSSVASGMRPSPAQPIAIEDVLEYLVEAIDLPDEESQVVEIGGPDQVSYGEIMKEFP